MEEENEKKKKIHKIQQKRNEREAGRKEKQMKNKVNINEGKKYGRKKQINVADGMNDFYKETKHFFFFFFFFHLYLQA